MAAGKSGGADGGAGDGGGDKENAEGQVGAALLACLPSFLCVQIVPAQRATKRLLLADPPPVQAPSHPATSTLPLTATTIAVRPASALPAPPRCPPCLSVFASDYK